MILKHTIEDKETTYIETWSNIDDILLKADKHKKKIELTFLEKKAIFNDVGWDRKENIEEIKSMPKKVTIIPKHTNDVMEGLFLLNDNGKTIDRYL